MGLSNADILLKLYKMVEDGVCLKGRINWSAEMKDYLLVSVVSGVRWSEVG